MRFSCFASLATLALLGSAPLWAASFIVPPDSELIDRADAIVIATANSSRTEPNDLVGIVTVTDLGVERILKGEKLDAPWSLRLTELGGELNGKFVLVDGSPRFAVGERVLLFLEKTSRGEWRTLHMVLGKFNFVRDPGGNRMLIRPLDDEVAAWDPSEEQHVERVRDEDRFLAFIEARLRDEDREPNYFVEVPRSVYQDLKIAIMQTRTDYLLTSGGLGFRWPNPDADFKRNGDVPGRDAANAITTGMGMWNGDAASNVSYSYGGTTATTAPSCAPPCNDHDHQNTVVFNDPHGIVSESFGPGGGTLGIGILYGVHVHAGGDPPGTPGTHAVGSETFISISEGDVVMNDGISSSNVSQALLNHALAHELGHTLGFRHSNESGRTPNTTNAVMRSSIVNVYTSLQQWDEDAVQTVYGSGPACVQPSITTQPAANQTIDFGQSATLTVVASGTTPTYQWHRGTSGTVNPITGATSASYNTGALTATTSYWVKVSNSCGNVNSSTATVTVNPCVPPSISNQPDNKSIVSGQSTTLTVSASGSTSFTYQWYRGTSGNTTYPVGTNSSSYSTGALSSTTSYWVRVTNSCGSVNSNTATVTVSASCTAPAITTQPQSTTISTGQSATLSVGATGTSLSYAWYRGASGTTSSGILGTSPTFSTGSLTSTTSYWVRVTNSCGQVSSATATVTVGPACTTPAITVEPQDSKIISGQSATLSVTATGTSLIYEWYRGPRGDTSSGILGTASTFSTGALTSSTDYWVRVRNACGQVDSATATVTVTRPRKRAARRG